MESDPRFQWLEQRITTSLNPRREALLSLTENEDNKFVDTDLFHQNLI